MTLTNDELRKAVEAAPGWNPDCKNVVTTKDGIGKLHFPDDKTLIAALASALVELVDAEPRDGYGYPQLVSYHDVVALRVNYSVHETIIEDGPNRNENTIRAVLAWLESKDA